MASGNAQTAGEIVARLKSLADEKKVEGMASFGINPENTLGISMPVLRAMGKEYGPDLTSNSQPNDQTVLLQVLVYRENH